MDHLLKTKKEYENFKKQKIHNIFKKQTRQSFSIIWLMKILRVCLEDKLLIKYYVIKHLILLKIPNMISMNANFHYWFINILIKSLLLRVHGQRPELCKIQNKFAGSRVESEIIPNHQLAKELHKQIMRKSGKRKYTHLLKTIFGVLI